MKTYCLFLTLIIITIIVCRTLLVLDYQKTEQVLSHLDGTSSLHSEYVR